MFLSPGVGSAGAPAPWRGAGGFWLCPSFPAPPVPHCAAPGVGAALSLWLSPRFGACTSMALCSLSCPWVGVLAVALVWFRCAPGDPGWWPGPLGVYSWWPWCAAGDGRALPGSSGHSIPGASVCLARREVCRYKDPSPPERPAWPCPGPELQILRRPGGYPADIHHPVLATLAVVDVDPSSIQVQASRVSFATSSTR